MRPPLGWARSGRPRQWVPAASGAIATVAAAALAAIGNGWANPGGQDITFVDDMNQLIENDLCVDTTQLFAMGFSFGGSGANQQWTPQ